MLMCVSPRGQKHTLHVGFDAYASTMHAQAHGVSSIKLMQHGLKLWDGVPTMLQKQHDRMQGAVMTESMMQQAKAASEVTLMPPIYRHSRNQR